MSQHVLKRSITLLFCSFIIQAPAAFGLVSFLLHENYERNRIRKHLFIFAMAAPVAALITFFGLNHVSNVVRINVAENSNTVEWVE